ncbi:hypothetical protein Loshitsa2_00026 [Erwinia phage Loshitsa2]|uniref:Uncharacterized protein n=1 Tax=Erwinia phage Loshitsa2 TaxID=2923254 RepID=A0AAE9FN60_9CAUD|nr:hypothetical protein Loshitsa2_00026 [Erwinia phage Loshitsa2]
MSTVTHYALFQLLFAEAVAVPYDRSAINRTRAALYRLSNLYGIDPQPLMQRIKANKKAVKEATDALAAQGEMAAAVATMGTLATQVGWMAGHVHTPLEDLNIPQMATDIFGMLNTLAVLDKLPTAKAA